MTILQLVVIIFALGALAKLAEKSGWVKEPFLQIGTAVAIGGVVLYILYVLLSWAGVLDVVTHTRLP